MENFDGLGRWRARSESGDPIDAVSTLEDGSTLDGATGLREWLLDRSDAFVANMTERLLTFALGRDLAHTDMPVVRKIVREAALDNHTFASLVLGVVESYPFQMRRADTADRTPRVAAMNAPILASARGVSP